MSPYRRPRAPRIRTSWQPRSSCSSRRARSTSERPRPRRPAAGGRGTGGAGGWQKVALPMRRPRLSVHGESDYARSLWTMDRWMQAIGRWSYPQARRRDEPSRAALGRPGEDEDADLGHVLDGEAEALATEPRFLHPAVRHVIDPVGRDVVDDDPADLELVERMPGVAEIVGEHTRLEAERRIVDGVDGIAQIGEAEHDDERRECLIRADLGVEGDVREDRRREIRTIRRAAEHDLTAERDGLVDPTLCPRGRGLVDHRPEVGRRVERIAHLQSRGTGQELRHERVVDVVVEVQALDADADLAGVGERPGQ